MPTRNVVITQHQADMIDELVEDGVYQNASEVLREGLRLVQKDREAHAAKIEALRAAAEAGLADIAAGRFITFDDDQSIKDHFDRLTERAIGRALKAK